MLLQLWKRFNGYETAQTDADSETRPDLERSSTGKSSHRERGVDYSALGRDFIIGFSDGLTVPFALTAGLSSLGSTRLVIIGGLAELFSGSISMGLGAFMACLQDAQLYLAEESKAKAEVMFQQQAEEESIFDMFSAYGISRKSAIPMVTELKESPEHFVKFIMDFEVKLEKPKTGHAWLSALTMGLAYFLGGILPMIPYFCLRRVDQAFLVSIGLTIFVLLVFGYVRTLLVVSSQKAAILGAIQTLAIGAFAAGASYGIVRAMDSK